MRYKLRDISFKEYRESKGDFKKIVENFYRSKAANIIKITFKTYQAYKKILTENGLSITIPEVKQLLVESLRKKLSVRPKLQEPVATASFSSQIKYVIKQQQYHNINFAHQDFTRYLFAALRTNHITMNEMMTAKLMYDALICFNKGMLPDKHALKFQRYPLNSQICPYKPAECISYWQEADSNRLDEILKAEADKEKYHLYTIDLAHHQVVLYLYLMLKEHPIHIPNNTEKLLKAYFQSVPDKTGLNALSDFTGFNEANTVNFRQIILNCEPELQLFLEAKHNKDAKNSYLAGLDLPAINREFQTIAFLVKLSAVKCQIPTLCLSPNYMPDSPQTPIISFIIPTIDTLNLLQQIVHKDETTTPVAVIGAQTTRMIRAYDEIPTMRKTNAEQTAASNILSLLTPTAETLPGASRPIEFTHPDAPKTQNPHGADCHDFMLSWHDLLHAWRNGANFKAIIRRLRHIHDEKAGFALACDGMSKEIWTLTDIDFSYGRIILENIDKQNPEITKQLIFINLMEQSGFNFNNTVDYNYLLIMDMLNNEEIWKDFFPPNFFGEHGISELKILLLAIERAKLISQYFSDKCIIKNILFDLLSNSNRDLTDTLLKITNNDDYHAMFYWSKNNGIYFKQELREELAKFNIKPRLRDNTPQHIFDALILIYSKLHPEFFTEKSHSLIIHSNLLTEPMTHHCIQNQSKNLRSEYKKPISLHFLTTDILSIPASIANHQEITTIITIINKFKDISIKFNSSLPSEDIELAHATFMVYKSLKNLTDLYIKNTINTSEYHEKATKIINIYKPTLEKDKETEQLMLDILNALLVVFCIVKYFRTGSFRLFQAKSKSTELLTQLTNELSKNHCDIENLPQNVSITSTKD